MLEGHGWTVEARSLGTPEGPVAVVHDPSGTDSPSCRSSVRERWTRRTHPPTTPTPSADGHGTAAPPGTSAPAHRRAHRCQAPPAPAGTSCTSWRQVPSQGTSRQLCAKGALTGRRRPRPRDGRDERPHPAVGGRAARRLHAGSRLDDGSTRPGCGTLAGHGGCTGSARPHRHRGSSARGADREAADHARCLPADAQRPGRGVQPVLQPGPRRSLRAPPGGDDGAGAEGQRTGSGGVPGVGRASHQVPPGGRRGPRARSRRAGGALRAPAAARPPDAGRAQDPHRAPAPLRLGGRGGGDARGSAPSRRPSRGARRSAGGPEGRPLAAAARSGRRYAGLGVDRASR